MYENAIQTPMVGKGDIAAKLTALRERAGLTVQQVAEELSRIRGETVSKTSYGHYESAKFKQRSIPLPMAQELAHIYAPLGVPEGDVLELAGLSPKLLSTTMKEHQRPVDTAPQPEVSRNEDAPGLATEQDDLPVFGYVAGRGEDDVFFIDQGHMMDRTVRPHTLLGVSDAYSVDVYGDSMYPVFRPGDRLHVHPRRPYSGGDDVVVQLDGERAILKRVVRKMEKTLVLEQFNPPKEITLKWDEVKQVDLVVGVWKATTGGRPPSVKSIRGKRR